MKTSGIHFACALAIAAGFPVITPARAVPLETDTLVGLIAKTNPKNLEGKAPQGFANTVYCNELMNAANEFDRQDAYRNVAARMKRAAASANPLIEGVARNFQFFPYNFDKQTLQINRGDYDWARAAPLGNLLNDNNRRCWQNPGHMMGMPNIVEALPDWSRIPHVLNVPQEEARQWFDGGPPSASLIFSIKVDKYMLEPMGSPKVIFRGQTTAWELVIFDGQGREVRRFESAPTPQAVRAPDSGALSQGQSRIVTSSFNVRQQPDLNGTLISTLGPNAVFKILQASDDGQWMLVDAAPVVKGWANTAVLQRSSRPNAPEASATASLQAPKPLSGEALHQKMLFLMTGLDKGPYTFDEEFHNAHGTHTQTTRHTYEPSFDGPCVLKFKYTSKVTEHVSGSGLGNYSITSVVDFRNMTKIEVRYTEEPTEGMMWAFAGGPSNPHLRKPRFVNIVRYFGDKALCTDYGRGKEPDCTTADSSGPHYPLPNPSKRPKHYQDAFKAVKEACK